ncbi:hypothetical protein [Neomegalonema sp.]|uniref:hypothetical protein n=1 Tax=Neomegalonema sp. TaxID=2039713 RepID=UPI00260B0967|nr:hypothetical protein [Neomegalonema sp.]MDD2869625.1 hypothetical protein [Neomegalonema sp.]
MAKDPAFLFYPNDWLGGTIDYTILEQGAYFMLIIFQFNNGHLPLEKIKRLLKSDFDSVWPVINEKFKVDENGLYFNKRLEDEQNKRFKYCESRRNNRMLKTYDEDNSIDG